MGSVNIAEQIEGVLEPLLRGEGYELILTEYIPRTRILRLYIDRALEDRGGVTLDDCTQVTHFVGDCLDAEGLSDLIPGAYTLEISSPGLDRPLAKPQHFQRFTGQKVQVVLAQAQRDEGGRRKFTGTLVTADADATGGICLVVDERPREFGYADIERARLVPEY